jgi:HPt (histidine-containing phosphotransfer) domain-containing protein
LPTKNAVRAQTNVLQQLDELTSQYKDTLPGVALELEQLVQQGNLTATMAMLHRIKGTSACFGFTDISDLAADAEKALKNDLWPVEQLHQLLRQIRQEHS